MSSKIIVLGGGMIGSAIARDLQEDNHTVTVADIDQDLQERLTLLGINYVKLDFSDLNAVAESVKSYDIVVGAVPGFMGYEILRTVLKSRKNIVDISFMHEDSRKLDSIAKINGVSAITDAGIAPGLSNLMFGRVFFEFDRINSAKCFVGGLPLNPQPPWFYKSVFSPIDVVEEYTRPARLVENGKIISKRAMTEIEPIVFKKVGILDAFNSDGLRSLLDLPIPDMVEKTLRFPGHIQKIIKMRNNGLFEPDKINETAKSLKKEWTSSPKDYDQTILRLKFEGVRNGNNITEIYDLIDYYDKQKNISSMARTTGYTCASVVNILLSGTFSKKGVFTMETLASDSKLFDFIISYLSNRNIQFENSTF